MRSAPSPHKRKRLEAGLRRSIELLLLFVSLVVGLAVVGGCGTVSLLAYQKSDAYFMLGIYAGFSLALIGVVYLFTSMSRDIRLLDDELSRLDKPDDPPA